MKATLESDSVYFVHGEFRWSRHCKTLDLASCHVGQVVEAPDVTPELEKQIARRSIAVPLACALAIILSFVSIFLASISFALIPLFARLFDPTSRKRKPAAANEEAAA